MNQISIENEFGYNNYNYVQELIEYTLKHEKVSNGILSVIFTTDEEIQKLNKEYRNIDKVTDVISFAFEDNKNIVYNEFRVLGDIYISIPQMKKQASMYEHSEKRELSFLIVHGVLHLLGYDHQDVSEEKKMFELQELILNEKNIRR